MVALSKVVNATTLLKNLRKLIAESKLLIQKTLNAVKNGDFEKAEKLATTVVHNLDEASKVLKELELKTQRW